MGSTAKNCSKVVSSDSVLPSSPVEFFRRRKFVKLLGGKFVRCALVIPILGSVNVRSAFVADTALELIVPPFCFRPLTGCVWSYFHVSSWIAVGILLFSPLSSTTHNHGTKKDMRPSTHSTKRSNKPGKTNSNGAFPLGGKFVLLKFATHLGKNKFAEICFTVFLFFLFTRKASVLFFGMHKVEIPVSLFLPWMGGPLFTMENFGLSLCENSFGGCFHSPMNKRSFLARFSVKTRFSHHFHGQWLSAPKDGPWNFVSVVNSVEEIRCLLSPHQKWLFVGVFASPPIYHEDTNSFLSS